LAFAALSPSADAPMTASTWCFHVFYAPLNLLGVPVETGSKTTFSPRGFAKRAFGPHGGNVATLVAVEFRQHRTSLIGIRAFFGAKTAGAQIQMSAILIRGGRGTGGGRGSIYNGASERVHSDFPGPVVALQYPKPVALDGLVFDGDRIVSRRRCALTRILSSPIASSTG
jgi:hypothetical protein